MLQTKARIPFKGKLKQRNAGEMIIVLEIKVFCGKKKSVEFTAIHQEGLKQLGIKKERKVIPILISTQYRKPLMQSLM